MVLVPILPHTAWLQVLLEDYTITYTQAERRLADYELDNAGTLLRRIGYLPKDAPRKTGKYLATLQRLQGKKRLEGKLSTIKEYRG